MRLKKVNANMKYKCAVGRCCVQWYSFTPRPACHRSFALPCSMHIPRQCLIALQLICYITLHITFGRKKCRTNNTETRKDRKCLKKSGIEFKENEIKGKGEKMDEMCRKATPIIWHVHASILLFAWGVAMLRWKYMPDQLLTNTTYSLPHRHTNTHTWIISTHDNVATERDG